MLKKDNIPIFVGVTILAAAFMCTTCTFVDLFLVSLGLEGTNHEMFLGGEKTLELKGSISNAGREAVKWESKNPGIAKVNSSGKVTVNYEGVMGTATIIASVMDLTETFTVTVVPFDNIGDAKEYYSNKAETDPVFLPMRLDFSLQNSSWKDLLEKLASGTKGIELELSACTNMGKDFYDDVCLVTEKKIVSLVLPNDITENIFTMFNYDALTFIRGDRVTKIKDWAFSGRSSLTEIHFPSVAEIGVSAFNSCGLQDVSLPAITHIGTVAFASCPLEKVTIGADCDIEDSAFDEKDPEDPLSRFGTYYNYNGKLAGTYTCEDSTWSYKGLP